MQKLKVDTESAMLEIDQILKANELSIALVAAIPSFLIAGVSLVGIWRWLSPKAVDPKWEALPCRSAIVMSKYIQQMQNVCCASRYLWNLCSRCSMCVVPQGFCLAVMP